MSGYRTVTTWLQATLRSAFSPRPLPEKRGPDAPRPGNTGLKEPQMKKMPGIFVMMKVF